MNAGDANCAEQSDVELHIALSPWMLVCARSSGIKQNASRAMPAASGPQTFRVVLALIPSSARDLDSHETDVYIISVCLAPTTETRCS
jgi:hypothetical protein